MPVWSHSFSDTKAGCTHEVCVHGEGAFVWFRKELASDTDSPSPSRTCTALGSGRKHMRLFTSWIKSSILPRYFFAVACLPWLGAFV